MKKSFKSLAIAIIAVPGIMCISYNVKAQGNASSDKMNASSDKMEMKKDGTKMKMDMNELKSWPMSSQMAVKEQMDLYGKPDDVTPTMVVWHNNGPWKKTVISKME